MEGRVFKYSCCVLMCCIVFLSFCLLNIFSFFFTCVLFKLSEPFIFISNVLLQTFRLLWGSADQIFHVFYTVFTVFTVMHHSSRGGVTTDIVMLMEK